MQALIAGLNVAYGEREERGLLRRCGSALLFALGAMAFVTFALGGVLGVPLMPGLFNALECGGG